MSVRIISTAGMLLSELLVVYIETFASGFGLGPAWKVFRKHRVAANGPAPDETLAKLDEAKEAMSDALTALEGVRDEARTRILELEEARLALNSVLASKAESEEKLKAIQKIADSDLATFRKMAGVASPTVVFLSGVFASTAAALLWWGVPKLWTLGTSLLAG